MGKATHAEVASAIEALEQGDRVRLLEFAENRIARIGPRAANGRTADDLLQEASQRTLEGTRSWNPKQVDLKGFLMGAMRSISSAWAAHYTRNQRSPDYAPSESNTGSNPSDGNGRSVIDGLTSQTPSPEDELIRSEEANERAKIADQIEEAFADDEDALTVILGLEDGMSLRAIRDEFGWEDNRIRATVRRIKRMAKRFSGVIGEQHAVR